MLDPGQDAPARDAVANEAKGMIEGDGTLKHENVWGLRKMAYEIGKSNEADYRWFRFEAQPPLLEQLDHSLKIADGVLRFRIFKVDADTPILVPPATSAPGPGASRERPSEAPPAAPAPSAPEPPAAEPAATESTPAEPAAETPAPAEPAPVVAEPVAEAAPPEAPAEGDSEGKPSDSDE